MNYLQASKKTEPAQWLLLGVGVAAAAAAARIFSVQRICGAQMLADALLHTDPLQNTVRADMSLPEEKLAACAGYLAAVVFAAAHSGLAGGVDDYAGQVRNATHSYTEAAATVLTESTSPDQVLTYTVQIPGVGEVRGSRTLSAIHFRSGLPMRSAPDTMQITLQEDYVAQIESLFCMQENLLTGQAKPYGSAILRDNRGTVGRLYIAPNGGVSGAVTRDARVVGRLEGTAPSGMVFRPHLLNNADEENRP